MAYLPRFSTDYDKFAAPAEAREVRYGLPRQVEFCRRSVISNQRPNSAVEFQHSKDSLKSTINFEFKLNKSPFC